MSVAAVAGLALLVAQVEAAVPTDGQVQARPQGQVESKPRVQVEGTTSCPTPEAVAARLAELLPLGAATEQPDRARISEEGGELVIVLEGVDGALLGTRRLHRTHACPDLAAATAVFLAAWESDVHPEFASGLVARAPASSLTKRPLATAPRVLPPPPSWAASAGLSLGFGGSVDGPAAAGGVAIGGWLTPPGARTSLRAEIEGQSERQISLGDGRASWRRWSLGVGLERPFFAAAPGEGDGWLRWFALARLAWLQLRGEGFAVNHRDSALDPGAAAGLRALWARGRWSAWVELAGSAWPLRHDALSAAGGGGDVAVLPVGELFLRIGGGLGSPR